MACSIEDADGLPRSECSTVVADVKFLTFACEVLANFCCRADSLCCKEPMAICSWWWCCCFSWCRRQLSLFACTISVAAKHSPAAPSGIVTYSKHNRELLSQCCGQINDICGRTIPIATAPRRMAVGKLVIRTTSLQHEQQVVHSLWTLRLQWGCCRVHSEVRAGLTIPECKATSRLEQSCTSCEKVGA